MDCVLNIGEQTITQKDLFPLLAQYQILPQLAREIIIEQAIADIECTEEEKITARQQFCQQLQINTEEQLQAWGNQQFMTPEQLENKIVRGLKIEKFKQKTWENKIESYFLKRKGQLDKVIYSLIRTQDAGIAQELFFRIQENETSFADLARQYSQGSESQTGGLVGPVELSVPHPKISQLLMASKPGQLLPPTRIENWLVIVRLEKLIFAELDQQMRQRLMEELFRNWLQEQMQQQVSLSESTTT